MALAMDGPSPVAKEDLLRADLYDLLGTVLSRPPDGALLGQLAALSGDDTPMGQAIGAMARLAGHTGPEAAGAEFAVLFVGLTRGELMPYASYYMTGFLHEKPLAVLRNDMRRLGIERTPTMFEPEDNIASLCEMMAGLIRGRFGPPADLARQRDFYQAHIAPWAGHFFTDLEGAKSSVFYAPIGAVGRTLVEIEREAFRLGA